MINRKIKFVILFALMIIISAVIMSNGYVGTRLYPGNRIKANLHINIDGKPVDVTKNDNRLYILAKRQYGATIKHRANIYNTFEYNLLINNDIPMTIYARHWNWWEITRSDVYIDIDTKSQAYTVRENYKYTKELPKYHIEKVQEEAETISGIDSIEIYVGPKG